MRGGTRDTNRSDANVLNGHCVRKRFYAGLDGEAHIDVPDVEALSVHSAHGHAEPIPVLSTPQQRDKGDLATCTLQDRDIVRSQAFT